MSRGITSEQLRALNLATSLALVNNSSAANEFELRCAVNDLGAEVRKLSELAQQLVAKIEQYPEDSMYNSEEHRACKRELAVVARGAGGCPRKR